MNSVERLAQEAMELRKSWIQAKEESKQLRAELKKAQSDLTDAQEIVRSETEARLEVEEEVKKLTVLVDGYKQRHERRSSELWDAEQEVKLLTAELATATERIRILTEERNTKEGEDYWFHQCMKAEAELVAEHDALLAETRSHVETAKFLAEAKAELAAYKKAKAENDERYMIERDEARAELVAEKAAREHPVEAAHAELNARQECIRENVPECLKRKGA